MQACNGHGGHFSEGAEGCLAHLDQNGYVLGRTFHGDNAERFAMGGQGQAEVEFRPFSGEVGAVNFGALGTTPAATSGADGAAAFRRESVEGHGVNAAPGADTLEDLAGVVEGAEASGGAGEQL